MKTMLRTILIVLAVSMASCGGGGAPPASIPAPVSSLLSITPPGPTGAIDISGAPGAVLPNATVQAQNITRAGPFSMQNKWKNWLLGTAYAQMTFFDEVVADAQGGFVGLRIDGQSGDIIGVRQEVNGDFSPDTQLTVP